MHIVVYSMRAVGADVFISRFAVLPTAGFLATRLQDRAEFSQQIPLRETAVCT